MRRRLGESPGAFAPYGPLIVTSDSAGSVPRLRIRGRSVDSSRTSSRSMKVIAETIAGPAVIGIAELERTIRVAFARSRLRLAACPPDAGADRRELRAGAVDRNLELMWFRRRRRELHFDQVFAVGGKVAVDREPAARTPWQIVDARALPQLGAEAIAVHEHGRCDVADREPADFLRRVEIALHDRRRHEEKVGEVVEAARRVIGRQQKGIVDLIRQRVDGEQIANRVLVLACG